MELWIVTEIDLSDATLDRLADKVADRLAKKVAAPEAELLTVPQVTTLLGCSEAWLYRLRKRYDDFPEPVKLAGYRKTYYRRAELVEWRERHAEIEDD